MGRPPPAPEQWASAVGWRDVEVSTRGAVRGPRGPIPIYRLGRQDIVDIDGRPVAVEVLKAAAFAPAARPVKAEPAPKASETPKAESPKAESPVKPPESKSKPAEPEKKVPVKPSPSKPEPASKKKD
jgi:hypothetical protein